MSPPAVENASGKLLAAKTTTGPIGTSIFRISGLGIGFRSISAISIEASNHDPSEIRFANILSCPTVLPLSPTIRALGRPDSAQHRSINSSPRFSISSAIAFKKSDFFFPEIFL